jgi:sugar/nucleoside kinase (ribokinase family)
VRESNVLKCNLGEAGWLLAEEQLTAAAAAESLLDLGPELVVVTAGTAPAVARGACTAAAEPPAVEVVSPLGAGDAFMGTLAAKLHVAGFDLTRADEALVAAVEQGAQACAHLGAFPR